MYLLRAAPRHTTRGDFSEESMHASAVDLFTARARAANPRYPMDPETLRLTMAVCGHLDGIPLAIELAVARAAVFGIQVVAANMADPFGVLADGCRTASPRQRTFRATLDWSYRTLNENERVISRGVSTPSRAGAARVRDAPAQTDVDAPLTLQGRHRRSRPW